MEKKNRRIAELEGQMSSFLEGNNEKVDASKCPQQNETKEEKTASWKKDSDEKNARIAELEEETRSMNGSTDTRTAPAKRNEESWKKEVDAKNRRIVELEQMISSLENFLREHEDTEGIRELEAIVERKNSRIEELEETVAEFEDFLKQNPDVKDLHDLRCQVTISNRRIQELEEWIKRTGNGTGNGKNDAIDHARIMELEEMVTHLEDYVRKHNVDVLKQKLQDRECRIEQLQARVNSLEKELLKIDKSSRGKDAATEKAQGQTKDVGTQWNYCKIEDSPIDTDSSSKERQEMDEKVKEYEKQLEERDGEITSLRKRMTKLERELREYEAEDIGVLKEEIRVRDERISQLEDDVESLERALNEGLDIEQMEELMNVIKKKEAREHEFERDIESKRNRIEELSEALRESVVIASDGEKRLKREEKIKRNALERVLKLEQRIASMQTVAALKCPTCKPLLSRLHNSEEQLQRLQEEKTSQMEDLHQLKREALKAALSEKDAHLALLELSGIKTAQQAEQADKLKVDRKKLLERLKKEDERSIEFSTNKSPLNSGATPQGLTYVLESSDSDDRNNTGEESDYQTSSASSPNALITTNGDSRDHVLSNSTNRE